MTYNTQVIASTLSIEAEDLTKTIRAGYAKDRLARNIKKEPTKHQGFEINEGIIQYKGLIYVPKSKHGEIIRRFHEEPTAGHQGIDRTTEKISRTYYFPGMNRIVRKWIAECDICRKTKHERHRPYGEMISPSAPSGAWKSIAMDFVTKLPESKEKMTKTVYDSILVITDRLTKWVYFIPYKEASNAEDLAYTFIKYVVANHGMPEEIISDRDKLFTSKFWKSLMAQLGTKQKMSTAFHPQTDGQTERANQTMEQYLRAYVNYEQDNWVGLLPLAQFVCNDSISSLGETPFYANYGFNPKIQREAKIGPESEQANVSTCKLQQLQQQLRQDMELLAIKSKGQYDKKRSGGPDLREGDPVYLLRKNVRTKRPSSKLDFTKLGPFEIDKVLGKLTYRLKLPANMKIHPVFHISLLEPAPKHAQPSNIEVEPDEEYDVEKVLQHRRQGRTTEYLIKWSGYESSDNSWEPEANLSPETLEGYWKRESQAAQPAVARRRGAQQDLWALSGVPPHLAQPGDEPLGRSCAPAAPLEPLCDGPDSQPLPPNGPSALVPPNELLSGALSLESTYRMRKPKSCRHSDERFFGCTRSTSQNEKRKHTANSSERRKSTASLTPNPVPAPESAGLSDDQWRKVCRLGEETCRKKGRIVQNAIHRRYLFSLRDQARQEGDSVADAKDAAPDQEEEPPTEFWARGTWEEAKTARLRRDYADQVRRDVKHLQYAEVISCDLYRAQQSK